MKEYKVVIRCKIPGIKKILEVDGEGENLHDLVKAVRKARREVMTEFDEADPEFIKKTKFSHVKGIPNVCYPVQVRVMKGE